MIRRHQVTGRISWMFWVVVTLGLLVPAASSLLTSLSNDASSVLNAAVVCKFSTHQVNVCRLVSENLCVTGWKYRPCGVIPERRNAVGRIREQRVQMVYKSVERGRANVGHRGENHK